jgi:hypothetical protein
MTPLLRDVESYWTAQGIACAKPASEAAIKDFEDDFAVHLPADFVMYLRTLNGMNLGHQGDMDGRMISFWPLEEIRQDPCSSLSAPNVPTSQRSVPRREPRIRVSGKLQASKPSI